MNKKLIMLFAAGVSALVAVGAPTMHPYDLPASAGSRDEAMGCLKADEIVKAGGKLELGKWYTDWATCKQYCEENDIPLFCIWSNAKCVHCWYTDICFKDDKFKQWASSTDAGKVIYCFMAGGEKGCPDQSGSAAYNWMWYGGGSKLSAYPFVVLWWKSKGVNYRTTGDNLCAYANGKLASLNEKSVPDRIDNIAAKMENYFKDWHPTPEVTYAGGHFTQTNYPYASLQAEKTTSYVDVEIVRDSLLATNQVMKIEAPGKTAASVTVSWARGQLAQTNRIDGFATKWFVEGKDVTLSLMDGAEAASTVKIACVAPETSAGNPKWIGESFDFGEWTMDLDAAKKKVKNTSGPAYTVVSVQGSLWCPDCANVERNFLDVEDTSGNNRFAAWAKGKNVALVAVDIPNFSGPNETDCASPSLLSRTAYKTTLARAKEYPASGADASLTNAAWRSGLGYLTRKGITDAEAAKVFSRNHGLAKNNTYEGGFHRPEDGNANRTGVPIFVLLRKNGSVAARLTRMAAVSPMAKDQANFDNYIRRFEEMMQIADDNETEVENNYPSASNELSIKANGGSESATLSHADAMDVFRLDGVGGNALQGVTVKGESDAKVIVSLVTTNAAGKIETLKASTEQKLSDGISIEHTFAKAGSYFVKVEAADITSDEFKLEKAGSTFQSYTVSGSVVLVPQEDKATASPAAGSDKVTIKLTEGTRYYITGMAACSNLTAVAGAPAGFYVAKKGGNAELTLDKVDGEVSYQVWNAGAVEFVKTTQEVTESVCDPDKKPIDIAVRRLDGKSGAARMTVSVDKDATTLEAERFWLIGTNAVGSVDIDWADGETGVKTVKLYVTDDLLYDDTKKVTLAATVTSQVGDVKITDGKDRFVLTVTEDDNQDPGTAYFTRVEPTYTRKNTVYAREGAGAKIWAKRIDGSDGLVAGLLVSSVKGTKYTAENDSDLKRLVDVAPDLAKQYPSLKEAQVLYWASRETAEKFVRVTGIPAGETAEIVFQPVGELKTIAASNTVLIASVADDAPGFESETYAEELIRYVEENPVEIGVTGLVKGGDVSLRKISGSLPAGMQVGFIRTGDSAGVMTVSGVPTAKAGVYESVYRVREERDGKAVDGLAVRLVLTVNDPIMEGVPGVPEPAAEVRKTRTFKDVPVTNEDGTRLMGLLQVTIPPTGRVSAKFTGIDGTISFSAKSWNGYSPSESGWELQAAMSSNKRDDAAMGVVVYSDGGLGANIRFNVGQEDEVTYVALSDGKLWSKSASAADWKGYYTVALRHKAVLAEDQTGIAPTGDGFLTLKMTSTSACNKGTFKVAGLLPNGTKVSGSAVLALSDGKAVLPVFRSSSKDVLSVALGIAAKAQASGNRRCVETPSLLDGYWAHTERAGAKNDYEVGFTAHGSYYDDEEDLGGCCAEYYETNLLNFLVDGAFAAGIKVGDDTVTIDSSKENKYGVKLSFKRSTGIVSGTFEHPEHGKVSYTGIVVNGWGEGCGCGPGGEVFLPFMSGCYQYGSSSARRGGEACIDK